MATALPGKGVRMTFRAVIAATTALLLGSAGPTNAQITTQNPPKLPNTTAKAKKCGTTQRNGYSFRVYVTTGKTRITCASARRVVRRKNPYDIPGWLYFDWTKGGNGPWSDVYARRNGRIVVAAIINA